MTIDRFDRLIMLDFSSGEGTGIHINMLYRVGGGERMAYKMALICEFFEAKNFTAPHFHLFMSQFIHVTVLYKSQMNRLVYPPKVKQLQKNG